MYLPRTDGNTKQGRGTTVYQINPNGQIEHENPCDLETHTHNEALDNSTFNGHLRNELLSYDIVDGTGSLLSVD